MTAPQQQKIRITGPVVVTANRLRDGKVVYRASDGSWSPELSGAAIVTSAESAHTMFADARGDFLRVVDPYIAPVETCASGGARPNNLRESIRRDGPTIALPD